MTRTISKPNLRASGFDAMTDMINQINDPTNKGSKDPTIIITTPFDETKKNGIRLSEAVTNNFIFESLKAQAAITDIVDKEGNPVEGAGAFEFHYARFQSLYAHPVDTDLDKVAIQVFEQGFRDDGVGGFTNTPAITIKKASLTESNPHLELDADLDTETGTNMIAIGDKDSGSYTKAWARYRGYKDVFNSAKAWVTARDYKKGHLVTEALSTFEAKVDHTSSGVNKPPSSSWVSRTFVIPATWSSAISYGVDVLVKKNNRSYKSLQAGNLNHDPETSPTFWIEIFFAPSVNYSELTKGKAQYWVNAMGGYTQASVDNDRAAIVDPNVIIRDDLHPRTWVDGVFTNSASLPANILIGGNPFDGLKILVNGTGVGDFAGNDPNGQAKSNSVLQYRGVFGSGGDWFVFHLSQNDREVYDYRDGWSWTFNPCQGALSYVDGNGACIIGSRSSNAWVRGAYTPTDIIGVLFNGTFTVDAIFDCAHPVKHNVSDVIELGNEDIINNKELGSFDSAVFANFAPTFGVGGQRKFFAGLNFAWPWPRNANSDPHGAVTIGEKILLNEMDFLNMHQNHLEKRTWFGDDVEDFFPIRGFAFWEYFQEILSLGVNKPAGDYSIGLWLCDKTDNEVVIEWTHGHNDVTEPHAAPVSKHKVYRGLQGFKTIIPAQTIEVLDRFDWRNVVRGGLYTKDSFDENGRFLSSAASSLTFGTSNSRFLGAQKLHFAVDAFRMYKPLVATNVRENSKPDRNIQPEIIKADRIFSWAQLQNFVDTKALIFEFERNKYQIKSAGRCTPVFGDPVYYEDADAVDESDDSLPNTKKLVVDEIIYTMSKPAKGPGGFTVTRRLLNRVWP